MTPIKVQQTTKYPPQQRHGEIVEFVSSDVGCGVTPVIVWDNGTIGTADMHTLVIEGTAQELPESKTEIIRHEPEIGLLYRLVQWADKGGDLTNMEAAYQLGRIVEDAAVTIDAHNRAFAAEVLA